MGECTKDTLIQLIRYLSQSDLDAVLHVLT